jgi:hypothetical protein
VELGAHFKSSEREKIENESEELCERAKMPQTFPIARIISLKIPHGKINFVQIFHH